MKASDEVSDPPSQLLGSCPLSKYVFPSAFLASHHQLNLALCALQGPLPALATDTLTRRAGVSAEPPTGGRSFAMSTRESAMIRRRGALQIGIGHTRRVRVTKPMALSVTG